jgi:hypothetical protein
MHTHKAMMLEATPALFRHLIATDLGAKNAVLGVGAFAPRARAPPQVRGGRDVGASRPLRTPRAVTLIDPFRKEFPWKGITYNRTGQRRPSSI